MQITLRDEQYRRLPEKSERTGLSIAELMRRAVERDFGKLAPDQRRRALSESFGTRNVHHFPMLPDLEPAY